MRYEILEHGYHFATIEALDAETALDLAHKAYTYNPSDYNCTKYDYCETEWCARALKGEEPTVIQTIVLSYGEAPDSDPPDSDETRRADYMYDLYKDDRLTGQENNDD